jgi:hypothetical protein
MLQTMHQLACGLGKDIMMKHNDLMSFFILPGAGPQGKVSVVNTPWRSPEEKPYYIRAIRQILADLEIEAYSFVTEAWLATVDPRTQKELMNVPPKERSDREDCLIIMSRHRDGEHYSTKYHVEYDVSGRVTLGEAEDMGQHMSQGLMGNLFEEPSYVS